MSDPMPCSPATGSGRNTMNEQKTDAAPRCMEQQLVGIRDALLTLGITGDRLFARIREDIERGLIREVRTQLNFVDKIVNANDSGDGVCPFCAEGDFDLVGLKGHLLRGWCDKFNETDHEGPRTREANDGAHAPDCAIALNAWHECSCGANAKKLLNEVDCV